MSVDSTVVSSTLDSRAARAYLNESRSQFIQAVRAPAFAFPFLLLPVPLYLFFGVVMASGSKEIAANPLIDGEEKMVPNITRVFRRNQNLYVTFDVYDARPDPKNPKARRVKVSMSLFNEKGAKAFDIGPLDETQLAGTRPETVPVKFQVPLKDLAPGRYTGQINIIDEVGRKFAFPRTQLVVVP